MKTYEILMTTDAADDLTELRDYIAKVLCAPEAARACLQRLRSEIASLKEMPARCMLVSDEPWHTRGIRRLLVKNSFIYYRIDESAKKVYILNIIYDRRDQLAALSRMDNE